MKLQRPDPGIDAAKSGLHGKAGIFFSAGLLEKGEPRFDLQDLDPYLLFDSRESMIGTLENPTLDLNPAAPSTLDVITATRSGTATFTEPDGTIAEAQSNTVRVDYTQGAELTPTKFQNIGYTDFSSGWAAYLGTTALGAGYDSQASLVCSFTGNGQAYQYFTSVEGVTYTGSFWARAVSGSGPYRLVHGNSASGTSTSITLTSEWQFVSAQFLGRSGGGALYFGIGAQSGDSVEIAMPQVEEGTTASSFVANTTGSPKFIASATYGPRVPMILVEPSSENLITRSEDFSFSGWTKNGANVANGISSPDGNNTAFKLTEDASASGHYLQETITVSSATIYTASIFVKYQSREWIRFTDAESINRVHFNTRTGQFGTVVGTVLDYSSTQLDDGWHRITITSTSAGTAYSMRIILAESDNDVSFTGDGTSGIYVWGAQVETGSVATSYIPTSGGNAAARTRPADDLVISGSAFSDFFNASEGTTYIETAPKTTTNIPHIFEYHNSSDANANRMGVYLPSATSNAFVRSSGVTTASLSPGTINLNQLNRVAISYKVNDILGSVNGSSEVSDTSAALPSGLDKLHIGNVYNFSFPLNGHIKRLIYWPYHSDSL